MSSTKFKVKQVKSDSETGLETFVTLPIDQEDTARLMPSADNIDIGSSTTKWGNAYIAEVNCGTLNSDTIFSSTNLSINSNQNVTIDIDNNKSGSIGTFKVTANDGTDDCFTVNESGGIVVEGTTTLKGEVQTTISGSPLEIDSDNTILKNSYSDAAGGNTLTIRDSAGSFSALSILCGNTIFGEANQSNKGFNLKYDEVGTPDRLVLSSGVGSDTAEVFSVDVGSTGSANNDIVFKGIAECDPTTNYEGGFRSAHYGGSVGNPNLVYFSTESSNGHFNVNASDTGTFTLIGPKGVVPEVGAGELRLESANLNLDATNTIELNSAGSIVLNIDEGGSDSDEVRVKQNGNTILTIGSTVDTGPVYYTDINIPLMGNADYTNGYDLVWLHTTENGKPVGQVVADNTGFTGCHRYLIKAGESIQLGDAVQLDPDLKVKKTTEASSAACVGIAVAVTSYGPYEEGFVGVKPVDSLGRIPGDSGSAETMVVVAAVGDSFKGDLRGFKVCNEGGDIAAGDLLVTSSVPGRLMKQSDDVIRASTVGKAMQAVTFNDQGQADNVYGFLYCG